MMLRVLFCSPCCLAPPGKSRKAYNDPNSSDAKEGEELVNGQYKSTNLAKEGERSAGLRVSGLEKGGSGSGSVSGMAIGSSKAQEVAAAASASSSSLGGTRSTINSFKQFGDFDRSPALSIIGDNDDFNENDELVYDSSLGSLKQDLLEVQDYGSQAREAQELRRYERSSLETGNEQQQKSRANSVDHDQQHYQQHQLSQSQQAARSSSSASQSIQSRPLESRAIVTMTSTTRIGDYARIEYSKIEDLESDRSTATTATRDLMATGRSSPISSNSRDISQGRDSNPSVETQGDDGSDTPSSDSAVISPIDKRLDSQLFVVGQPEIRRPISQYRDQEQEPQLQQPYQVNQYQQLNPLALNQPLASNSHLSRQPVPLIQSHESRPSSPGVESTSLSIASQLSNEQLELSLTNALESVLIAPNQSYGTIGLPLGPPVGRYPSETARTSPDTAGAALTTAPSELSTRPSSPMGALATGIQSAFSGSQSSSNGAALVASELSPESSFQDPQASQSTTAAGGSSKASTLSRALKLEKNKDVLSKFRDFARKVLKDPKAKTSAKSLADSGQSSSSAYLDRSMTQSPGPSLDRDSTPTPSEGSKKKSKGLFGQVGKILKDKKKRPSALDGTNTL